jgi:hypothetical protein
MADLSTSEAIEQYFKDQGFNDEQAENLANVATTQTKTLPGGVQVITPSTDDVALDSIGFTAFNIAGTGVDLSSVGFKTDFFLLTTKLGLFEGEGGVLGRRWDVDDTKVGAIAKFLLGLEIK